MEIAEQRLTVIEECVDRMRTSETVMQALNRPDMFETLTDEWWEACMMGMFSREKRSKKS